MGHFKAKKACFLEISLKILIFFFLNLFCPLRKDFKTSFVKISKILKNLKLSKKFRTIFFPEGQKIMFFRNFSKDSQYFFLNVSRPLRKVFKTSFVKISKFLKNLKLSKKFRTIFFSEIFRYFEVCSRGDLVVFLGLCSSGDLERISEIGHFKAKKTCFLEIYHNILDLFF